MIMLAALFWISFALFGLSFFPPPPGQSKEIGARWVTGAFTVGFGLLFIFAPALNALIEIARLP